MPPLLADAPYAGRPGQGFPSHSGRGRNVLFADGHAAFLPVAASSSTAGWLGSREEDREAADPVVLISDR